MSHRISRHLTRAQESYDQRLGCYLATSGYLEKCTDPDVIDLAFGDPHEYPADGLVSLLRDRLVPRHESWFAYIRNHPPAQEHLARTLQADLGMPFSPADVAMTNGAFAGLTACLRAVCGPGDEVIYLNPSWFYYEPIIAALGAAARAVDVVPGTWELDLRALEAAITPATAAIIVNTPNNPTGVIYSAGQLSQLADLLHAASARHGHPVYLVADEAYRRIVFDGRDCPSPAQFYSYTLLVHTYTKSLLLPGERIGYVALPPTMPDRGQLREAVMMAQLMTGWAFPSNSLAFAASELEQFRVPVAPIQRRRDLLIDGLRAAGYAAAPCHGTFYLMARAPTPDDWIHAKLLEERGVLALPGSVMGAPGFIRFSLTVSDALLAGALGRIADAYGRSGRIPGPGAG